MYIIYLKLYQAPLKKSQREPNELRVAAGPVPPMAPGAPGVPVPSPCRRLPKGCMAFGLAAPLLMLRVMLGGDARGGCGAGGHGDDDGRAGARSWGARDGGPAGGGLAAHRFTPPSAASRARCSAKDWRRPSSAALLLRFCSIAYFYGNNSLRVEKGVWPINQLKTKRQALFASAGSKS